MVPARCPLARLRPCLSATQTQRRLPCPALPSSLRLVRALPVKRAARRRDSPAALQLKLWRVTWRRRTPHPGSGAAPSSCPLPRASATAWACGRRAPRAALPATPEGRLPRQARLKLRLGAMRHADAPVSPAPCPACRRPRRLRGPPTPCIQTQAQRKVSTEVRVCSSLQLCPACHTHGAAPAPRRWAAISPAHAELASCQAQEHPEEPRHTPLRAYAAACCIAQRPPHTRPLPAQATHGRRISFADEGAGHLEHVAYVDNLHYSDMADHHQDDDDKCAIQ